MSVWQPPSAPADRLVRIDATEQFSYPFAVAFNTTRYFIGAGSNSDISPSSAVKTQADWSLRRGCSSSYLVMRRAYVCRWVPAMDRHGCCISSVPSRRPYEYSRLALVWVCMLPPDTQEFLFSCVTVKQVG